MRPNRIYSDIDLSFDPHPVNGDIMVRSDVNAVKQSLKNLIMTSFYERPFHPEIGSPLRGLLFEPIDPITTNTIKQTIERLIFNFEPRVQLQSLNVVPSPDENSYEISLEFFVVGLAAPISFSTMLKRAR